MGLRDAFTGNHAASHIETGQHVRVFHNAVRALLRQGDNER